MHTRRSITRGTPARCRTLDELGVEVDVVGGEHTAVEPSGELDEGVAQRRRRAQRSAGDAVDVAWADAVPPVAEADECRPAIDHGAVGIDGDNGDLQEVVALRPQPGRLDVDDRVASRVGRHGLPHHRHGLNLHGGCHRPGCVQSSSAARLATSLRSHAVIVMWPKHGWPRNAWVSTARALFDSPR